MHHTASRRSSLSKKILEFPTKKTRYMKRKCWLYSLRQSTNCYSNYRAGPRHTHWNKDSCSAHKQILFRGGSVWSEPGLIDLVRIGSQHVVNISDQISRPAVKINFWLISCQLPHTTLTDPIQCLPLSNLKWCSVFAGQQFRNISLRDWNFSSRHWQKFLGGRAVSPL